MALGREADRGLAEAFQDLRDLKVDVAYPLLLELYRDYGTGLLPRGDFLETLRLIESYVFRRAICGIPTNSLNKTFSTFGRSLKKDRYLESVQAGFLLLPSYRRFPNNEEFQRELVVRDMYNFPRRSYWLRRLENHDRKERVYVDEYTIEHIMPQNDELSEEWRQDLGPEWERVHAAKLHTLGNLTLTGYNSEYSDRPFREKRDMSGGFKESPLHLNRGLGIAEHWDEVAIDARAARLAATATAVWQQPTLEGSVLSAYRPKGTTGESTYTPEDHPHLAAGRPMRALFEALRVQILALDPNIAEEILKLYIAYKAETNVVDVVPQVMRLRLSLNMPFPELSDPKGMARDVTNLGRWGNGDVEVGLSRDTPVGATCTRRAYAFDADTNRTTSTAYPADTDGACQGDTGGVATTHTYDTADRLQPAGVDTGLAYDAFGRTTTLPGYGGAGGTDPTTIAYYAGDLVRSETQGATTRAWGLDADGRFGTWTDTVAGSTTATKTNHYDDGSEDSPDWIAENADSTQWTANISDLLTGLGLTIDQTGTVTYQYANIHGDIACTAAPTDTTPTIGPDYDEYGNPADQTARRYGWLGGKQRSGDTLAGLILMGVRLYNPALGRFLSVDPEPGGSANDYDYCNADPINCTDLDGKWSFRKWARRAGRYIRSNWRDLAVTGVCIFASALGCALISAANLAYSTIRGGRRNFHWRSFAGNAALTLGGAAIGRYVAKGWRARNIVQKGKHRIYHRGAGGHHRRPVNRLRTAINWGINAGMSGASYAASKRYYS